MSQLFPKPKPAFLAEYLVQSNSKNIQYAIYFSSLACVVFGIQLLAHFRLGAGVLFAANIPYTLLYLVSFIFALSTAFLLSKLQTFPKLLPFSNAIEIIFSVFIASVGVFWSLLSVIDGEGIAPFVITLMLLCCASQGYLGYFLSLLVAAFFGLVIGLFWLPESTDSWQHISIGFCSVIVCFAVANLIEKTRLKNFEKIHSLTSTNKQLQTLSQQDHLTKLLNRRAIDSALKREMARSERFDHSLSLLMVDVDNFKQINDGFGHVFGDQILIDISSSIRKHVRDVDYVGRMGGDEFLVILVETNQNNALQIAERMLNEVRNINSQKLDCDISISIGFTAMEGESVVALLEKADKALYLAKKAGKNKVRSVFSQLNDASDS
ncbi:GGDEF domain-containing protein [Aliiglaciecola sp. 3_MG-2023]|uniref:GGDEF domain-containing protein n=1 Tax=Aliiglaciecola sp. 3_MG-2023 TaxID=3062644 RepID=UPI0026E1E11C|nr:GGDEF domain-containing protein [Aliiglaciecola sp. 3_MG-2023]MDO6692213.1 GGDEF domain-containing protein [Aliiglaciecola sp. 3_MG-2023]